MQDLRPAAPAGLSNDSLINDILASESFQKSPALRNLLKYLWEHRHEDLNEFQIAVDALGRKQDFNPKIDSTVRVQMMRMRQKLKDFYEKEGAGSRIRIHLPPGGHRLAVEEVPPTESARDTTPPPTQAPRIPSARLPWILTAAFAVVAVLAVAFSFTRGVRPGAAPVLPEFWRGFTTNGKPVRIVLANLAFFRWPNNPIKVRDTRINEFEDLPHSPELQSLSEKWGKPELMGHSYISAPDAYAASELATFLAASGIPVSVVGHREAALDRAGDFNRVFLGNVQSGAHLLPLISGTNFEPLAGFSFRNRQPNAGEPDVFPMVIESRRRETVPGVVYRREQVLVLMSENTTSLVRLLTSSEGLAKVPASGRFDVLAVADIEGGRVAKVQAKSLRIIP